MLNVTFRMVALVVIPRRHVFCLCDYVYSPTALAAGSSAVIRLGADRSGRCSRFWSGFRSEVPARGSGARFGARFRQVPEQFREPGSGMGSGARSKAGSGEVLQKEVPLEQSRLWS